MPFKFNTHCKFIVCVEGINTKKSRHDSWRNGLSIHAKGIPVAIEYLELKRYKRIKENKSNS
jgi:hypothetical protein